MCVCVCVCVAAHLCHSSCSVLTLNTELSSGSHGKKNQTASNKEILFWNYAPLRTDTPPVHMVAGCIHAKIAPCMHKMDHILNIWKINLFSFFAVRIRAWNQLPSNTYLQHYTMYRVQIYIFVDQAIPFFWVNDQYMITNHPFSSLFFIAT